MTGQNFLWWGSIISFASSPVCVHLRLVTQLCLTLCGPSAHGIFQARILEWVTISPSRGSPRRRKWTCISCVSRRILNHWATWKLSQPRTCQQSRLQPALKQQPPSGSSPALCSRSCVSEDASLRSPGNTLFRDISPAAWLPVPVRSFTGALHASAGQFFREPSLPFPESAFPGHWASHCALQSCWLWGKKEPQGCSETKPPFFHTGNLSPETWGEEKMSGWQSWGTANSLLVVCSCHGIKTRVPRARGCPAVPQAPGDGRRLRGDPKNSCIFSASYIKVKHKISFERKGFTVNKQTSWKPLHGRANFK